MKALPDTSYAIIEFGHAIHLLEKWRNVDRNRRSWSVDNAQTLCDGDFCVSLTTPCASLFADSSPFRSADAVHPNLLTAVEKALEDWKARMGKV